MSIIARIESWQARTRSVFAHRRAGLGSGFRLDGELHLRRVERRGQIVGRVERPALALPARALLEFRAAGEILILHAHGLILRSATSRSGANAPDMSPRVAL
jgi:hypothetical protein